MVQISFYDFNISRFQPLTPQDQNGPGIFYKVYWRRRDAEKEFQSLSLNNYTKEGVAIVPVQTEYYYTEYDVKVQVCF